MGISEHTSFLPFFCVLIEYAASKVLQSYLQNFASIYIFHKFTKTNICLWNHLSIVTKWINFKKWAFLSFKNWFNWSFQSNY